MAAWRSTTPGFRRRLVSLAKKVSTALSQEQEVGVKWPPPDGSGRLGDGEKDAGAHAPDSTPPTRWESPPGSNVRGSGLQSPAGRCCGISFPQWVNPARLMN
jgi:hypothetical protein